MDNRNALSTQSNRADVSSQKDASWDLMELSPLFDVRDIGGIIRRRFFLLLLPPILCVALALGYLFFVATPYYKSTALVFIDPKFDSILQMENVSSIASDLDSLNSLEKTIISDSMILRVVDKLDLRHDRDFLPKSLHKHLVEGEELSGSRLLAEIAEKRFKAGLIRPTRLIELAVYDTDPDRARLIAETFVSEFELFLGEQKRGEAGRSGDELRTQAETAYTRALDAEKELEKFRNDHPKVTVEQDHGLFAERLTKVGDELNTISSRVLELRSLVEALSDIDPKKEPVKVINIGRFAEMDHVSSLLDQRIETQSEFAAVAEEFTPANPRYKQAASRVANTEKALQVLATDLKSSLEADYEATRQNEKLLTARVEELQRDHAEVKSLSSEFRAIQQKSETEWAVHESLRQKIGETSVMTDQSTSITTLMSEPITGHKPATPNKPITVLAAGFLGGMLSLCIVGLDLLRRNGPVENSNQLERHLRVPVAAEIPVQITNVDDDELVQEMTKVLVSLPYRDARFFHLSSVSNGTSGLRVAACLASASAFYRHRTLLISVLSVGETESLVSLVPKESSTENLFTLTISANFLIAPRNAWELLGPHTQQFDRIVIESTAIPQQTQIPAMISSLANANLLLVKKKEDDRRQIEDAVALLARNSQSQVSMILQR